ncbi:MAG: ABC transporter permease [Lachnospiraceae bacterium]|nr:ABC transporter permease [Lachnospiraceae bacterium]MDE7239759.1 ABC transporter permease [Lachnospiraceae bacterium]
MNVFRKENERRVLFTLTLTLLTAVLSFGFVSRAVEYLAVRQELNRISKSYRTIGWLTSADGNNIAAGAKIIEASPYVETADGRGYLWGTLTDLYNAGLAGKGELPFLDEYGVNNAEVLFWGTLKYVDEDWFERNSRSGTGQQEASRLVFTVSERISGYPDYAAEGEDVYIVFTDELARSEGWELPELTVGERYLVRAYYSYDRNGRWNGYEMWVRAAGGHALTALSLPGNSPILPEKEGNEALSILASDGRMQFDELNRHSMDVYVTKDMSAMPTTQDVSKRMFLTEGRWLDGIDSSTGAAVCAVHKDFADARGLQVGDTVELTFRSAQLQLYSYAVGEQDVTDWQSYDLETRQYTIVGIFDYMPLNEGIHNISFENLELYIPYGSVSEAYVNDAGMFDQNFSFVLKDPQDTDAFLNEVREPLSALGMRIQLIENDWEQFAVSANAMERTARIGVLVFSGVMCTGFVLIAFLYSRQNRKSLGIARALGVPKSKCVRMCLSPMLIMSVIGIGAGALFSWHYALGEAEQMLIGMQEHAEMGLSVRWLAILVFVPVFLLTAAAAVGILIMARRTVTELLQDASGRRKRADINGIRREKEVFAKRDKVKMGQPSVGEERLAANESAGGKQFVAVRPAVGELKIAGQVSLPAEAGKGKGTRSAFRFVWRHMGRRPLHTTLMVVVALAFLAAVTWMQVSITLDTAEVERLYASTEVSGELVRQDAAFAAQMGDAFVTHDMLEWLMESGYVYNLYTEAADVVRVERTVMNRITGEILSSQFIGSKVPMRSTDNIERFCEENHVEIDYADGYGAELFTANWEYHVPNMGIVALKNDTPVLIPDTWLEQYGLEYGQKLEVGITSGRTVWQLTLVIAGSIRHVELGDGIHRGAWDKVMIPPSVLGHVIEEKEWGYSSVQFTVNPAFNRELDKVKEEIAGRLQSPRMALQEAAVMLWTGEIRQVVEPFEKNLDLMKLLFPVTVAVSVIAGGGLIFLLLLQRTEEAALLRVLGNSRGRTRRMLFAEPVLLSMLGLFIGGCAMYYGFPEISMRQMLLFAGVYLGGCVLGAIWGTVHITRKMPLELLQVKE